MPVVTLHLKSGGTVVGDPVTGTAEDIAANIREKMLEAEVVTFMRDAPDACLIVPVANIDYVEVV